MCIAQKTLKSMPSTSMDINQDNDDLDDVIFTPKSGPTSPVPTPLIHDRPILMSTGSEESHYTPSPSVSPDQITSITPLMSSSEPSSYLIVHFD